MTCLNISFFPNHQDTQFIVKDCKETQKMNMKKVESKEFDFFLRDFT